MLAIKSKCTNPLLPSCPTVARTQFSAGKGGTSLFPAGIQAPVSLPGLISQLRSLTTSRPSLGFQLFEANPLCKRSCGLILFYFLVALGITRPDGAFPRCHVQSPPVTRAEAKRDPGREAEAQPSVGARDLPGDAPETQRDVSPGRQASIFTSMERIM